MPNVWTLADGSDIDLGQLPPGQRICYFCMHVHPEEHIHTGVVDKERHAAAGRGDLPCAGCTCPDQAGTSP